MDEKAWAIIPAAGLGLRAKTDVPKQFIPFGGRTLLEITVSRVIDFGFIDGVVVSLPDPKDEPGKKVFSDVAGKLLLMGSVKGKPVRIVKGGSTRQESVYNGIQAVPADVQWLFVHDASRPFVTFDLSQRVFSAAWRYSAAVPGVPVTDTIKVSRKDDVHGSFFPAASFGEEGYGDLILFVDTTLNRDTLVQVQTPQIFRADLLRLAHEKARAEGFKGTDDSQLVERLGVRVAVVPGDRANVKITYPEDLILYSKFLDNLDENMLKTKNGGIWAETKAGVSLGSSVGPADGDVRYTGNYPIPTASGARWKWRTIKRHRESIMPVTGFGIDVHPFGPGRKCVVGGVEIPFSAGLVGHSDADVLCHAVMDAILGALSMGDIGQWFPPQDPAYEGANSLSLLRNLWGRLRERAEVLHVDCTVVAQAPKIMPLADGIRSNIARALDIDVSKVSLKATTPEGLGSLGRLEGMAAFALVTLFPKRGIVRGAQSI